MNYYVNTPSMQYTWIMLKNSTIFSLKKNKFKLKLKMFDLFLMFAPKMICGYKLEPPH